MDFDNMRFTDDHEWVRFEDSSDEVVMGITEFAAGELGDIIYVELPEVGAQLKAGDTMGTIEAVKTVADLYAPVSGVVKALNAALEDQPELVNNGPYEEGWFVKVSMSDRSELDNLMTHEAYQKKIGNT